MDEMDVEMEPAISPLHRTPPPSVQGSPMDASGSPQGAAAPQPPADGASADPQPSAGLTPTPLLRDGILLSFADLPQSRGATAEQLTALCKAFASCGFLCPVKSCTWRATLGRKANGQRSDEDGAVIVLPTNVEGHKLRTDGWWTHWEGHHLGADFGPVECPLASAEKDPCGLKLRMTRKGDLRKHLRSSHALSEESAATLEGVTLNIREEQLGKCPVLPRLPSLQWTSWFTLGFREVRGVQYTGPNMGGQSAVVVDVAVPSTSKAGGSKKRRGDSGDRDEASGFQRVSPKRPRRGRGNQSRSPPKRSRSASKSSKKPSQATRSSSKPGKAQKPSGQQQPSAPLPGPPPASYSAITAGRARAGRERERNVNRAVARAQRTDAPPSNKWSQNQHKKEILRKTTKSAGDSLIGLAKRASKSVFDARAATVPNRDLLLQYHGMAVKLASDVLTQVRRLESELRFYEVPFQPSLLAEATRSAEASTLPRPNFRATATTTTATATTSAASSTTAAAGSSTAPLAPPPEVQRTSVVPSSTTTTTTSKGAKKTVTTATTTAATSGPSYASAASAPVASTSTAPTERYNLRPIGDMTSLGAIPRTRPPPPGFPRLGENPFGLMAQPTARAPPASAAASGLAGQLSGPLLLGPTDRRVAEFSEHTLIAFDRAYNSLVSELVRGRGYSDLPPDLAAQWSHQFGPSDPRRPHEPP